MMKERKPNRLQGYDYSQDNLYFVTSCVIDRVCCFGEIVSNAGTGRDLPLQSNCNLSPRQPNGVPVQQFAGDPSGCGACMRFNQYGRIAEKQWHWLGEQYPYVVLHAFVVMPNHVHGIIEINREQIIVGTGRDLSLQQNNKLSVNRDLSLQNDDPSLKNGDLSQRQPTVSKIKSLSELMGAYKTTVSKQIHLNGYLDFAWQRSFHDHIIRNDASYQNIVNYILDNPSKWEEDEFYKNGK